jgi:ELWxxDGT repeat protein
MGGTVLGSTMLFEGEDSSGKFGLLVTDGTAAGTSELSVAGADASGLLSGDSDYPDFMVLGSKALFEGEDASGNGGLWVTDGTAAGTSELSVAGASSGGLDPNFFTVFGSKVLFGGEDSSGNRGLWVTDGTAAGTSEIATASNAYGGLGPSSFTVFGSKVLFNGTDSSGNSGLWVTDGTAGGTSELSVAGLSSAELVEGFGSGSAVLGAKVLFSGIDSSGDAISG